jgi:hypothetical protein
MNATNMQLVTSTGTVLESNQGGITRGFIVADPAQEVVAEGLNVLHG